MKSSLRERLTSPEMQARARAARHAAAVARAASSLRRDFMDADHWQALASARGLRLPPWGTPATSGMRSWLNKCGVSLADYYAWSGERSQTEFGQRNPNWPLRAWAGLVLEAVESGHLQPVETK